MLEEYKYNILLFLIRVRYIKHVNYIFSHMCYVLE